jgi:hypothetical protein
MGAMFMAAAAALAVLVVAGLLGAATANVRFQREL